MLTQEDVLSLGWEMQGTTGKTFTFWEGMWTLELRSWGNNENGKYPPNYDVIYISPTYRMGNYDSFHGRCSDKETLKLLMELLNIKSNQK